MKYPKQSDYNKDWVIGDNLWRVKFVRHIPHDVAGRICLGMTEPSEQIIYLKLGQGARGRFHTFLHEILHVIEDEYGLVIAHDLIYKLEEPLSRFVIDNFF